MISLRAMTPADLWLVARWLQEPHVAKWFLVGSTLEQEISEIRDCVDGLVPTHVLVAIDEDRPVGWCQWYLIDDYPEHALGIASAPGRGRYRLRDRRALADRSRARNGTDRSAGGAHQSQAPGRGDHRGS
jgi:hypothetical protein